MWARRQFPGRFAQVNGGLSATTHGWQAGASHALLRSPPPVPTFPGREYCRRPRVVLRVRELLSLDRVEHPSGVIAVLTRRALTV